MVSALTPHSISRVPLLTKTLLFLRITYGAVAYASVLPIKFVAKFAVSFLGVYCSNASGVFERIFSNSDSSQVRRIDAVSISTSMINDQSIRDIANMDVVGHPMGTPGFSSKKESSVSVFIKRTLPQMTITPFLPLGIKSRKLSGSISFHMPLLPITPLV